MNKEPSGKGYIQGGEGFFITSTGERYEYHNGELKRQMSVRPWPLHRTKPTSNKPQGVIEMNYQGMFELQPLYDAHQSFYGKAFVERWNTENGTQPVLKSYGTVVAKITPVSACGCPTCIGASDEFFGRVARHALI
jgi:hypothetical protein